jgi:hypothetical protein
MTVFENLRLTSELDQIKSRLNSPRCTLEISFAAEVFYANPNDLVSQGALP